MFAAVRALLIGKIATVAKGGAAPKGHHHFFRGLRMVLASDATNKP
jgi:hypothetical protein